MNGGNPEGGTPASSPQAPTAMPVTPRVSPGGMESIGTPFKPDVAPLASAEIGIPSVGEIQAGSPVSEVRANQLADTMQDALDQKTPEQGFQVLAHPDLPKPPSEPLDQGTASFGSEAVAAQPAQTGAENTSPSRDLGSDQSTTAPEPVAPKQQETREEAPEVKGAPEITGAAGEAGATPPEETREEAPTEEPIKVPAKVATDSGYRKLYAEVHARMKQEEGKDPDPARVDRQALSEYYQNWAKNQIDQGLLTDEVKQDPAYQRALEQVKSEAQQGNEQLDDATLSQRALARYQEEKERLEEQTPQAPTAEHVDPTQQRIQELEGEYEQVATQLKKVIERLEVTQKQLQNVTELLHQKILHDLEQDPEKKKSIWQTMLELAKAIGISLVIETAQVTQQTTQQELQR